MQVENVSVNRNHQLNIGKGSGEQYFYGHGKVLLSSEYFVLDGAQALALPVRFGQSLSVKYAKSFSPTLSWKSYDVNGKLWFDCTYEFWHFDLLEGQEDEVSLFLQKILRQARKQNPHFLREEEDVFVESKLGFPIEWGLGSSSSLIYNVAQWAYVSPFELLFSTQGGSGYDIACAQSSGPIIYEKKSSGPVWSLTNFDPPFKDNLYFIYLGHKQSTQEAIAFYRKNNQKNLDLVNSLSNLTKEMLKAKSLEEFENLVKTHEELISMNLNIPRVKDQHFVDYWGEVKSLGAWGGDFVMVSSNRSKEETQEYFVKKGHTVFLSYSELILTSEGNASKGIKDNAAVQ